ncbi:hypothetical protein [Pseudoxanthomonas mexicana]
MASTPSINIVFCDDVRRELDGRLSLMGVFAGLRLVSPDTTLPKIAVCVFLSAPVGYKTGEIKVRLTVEREGEIEHSDEFPQLPAVATVDAEVERLCSSASGGSSLNAAYAGVIEVQNFPVERGAKIHVVATERGKEIHSSFAIIAVDDTAQKPKVVVTRKKSKGKKSVE